MYLVSTMVNICFVVNALSDFMIEPRLTHWITMKRVL
jgi:hypothetical protein